MPLRHDWAVTSLGNVVRIWTRPVHIETAADD
jgi:hypothetical protein